MITHSSSGVFPSFPIWKTSLFAAFGATALNTILFLIGSAAGFMSDTVLIPNQNQPITLPTVLISSVVPALLAGVVLALLNRFVSNAVRLFTIISLLLLAVSFVNPFLMIPGIPLAMGLWLDLMHVAVAGSVLGAVWWLAKKAS